MNQTLLITVKRLVSELEKSEIIDPSLLSNSILPLLTDLFKIILVSNPVFVDYHDLHLKVDSKELNQRLQKVFKGDYPYNQVFDPIDDNEFVTFSLVNDIVEVYEGLKEYLHLCDIDSSAAEWTLQENFRSHLHQHVLNSIKVLYIGFSKDK